MRKHKEKFTGPVDKFDSKSGPDNPGPGTTDEEGGGGSRRREEDGEEEEEDLRKKPNHNQGMRYNKSFVFFYWSLWR